MTRLPLRVFLSILCAGVFLDQLTKHIAERYLSFWQPVTIIPSVLSFQLVHNFGAAYGILQHQRILLLSVSAVVIIGCVIWYSKIAVNRLTSMGLVFVLIGAIGNFADRLLLGYVIDFVDIRIFPVFNIADVCIDIGIGFFLLDLVLSYRHSTA